jgi:hypothetical protein
MPVNTGDILTAAVVHSPDDGGYYGEIFMSRLGYPGQQDETRSIYTTAAAARRATEELCRRLWPDHKINWEPQR